MLRRTTGLFACMILCWISTPSYAANISCFNPADASGMTELEWRAPGFLPDNEIPAWNDLPVMTLEEAQRAGPVNAFDPDAYLADTSCSGLLSGDIVKGDYEKVATFLDVRRPKMFALAPSRRAQLAQKYWNEGEVRERSRYRSGIIADENVRRLLCLTRIAVAPQGGLKC